MAIALENGQGAFELVRWEAIGGYAVQLCWADGHSTGLYTFDYLRRLDSMHRG